MADPRDVLTLFQTPVVVFDLPELRPLDQVLSAMLIDEERTVPSWKRANIGGWHSPPDLSQRPPFRPLIETIVKHVGEMMQGLSGDTPLPDYRYAVTAWAMVMRQGHYVVPHDHGDAHWSVAYYIDAGDDMPSPSGQLAFIDPRRSGRSIPGSNLFDPVTTVAPVTGSLVVFPGWLQHYVHTYQGECPRICVSANLTLDVVD